MKYQNEIVRLFQYMNETKLTMEEVILLYTVYIKSEVGDDVDFLSEAKKYYDRFDYYDKDNQKIVVPWVNIVPKLEREGYLITYPGYNKRGDNNNFKLNISKMEVTDKFKSTILDSDREKWWVDLVKLWGHKINIQDKSVDTTLPDRGESIEDVKKRFWNLCGNGVMWKIGEFFTKTEQYVEYLGANMKITTYLKNYDNMMLTLQMEMDEQRNRRSQQSTRNI